MQHCMKRRSQDSPCSQESQPVCTKHVHEQTSPTGHVPRNAASIAGLERTPSDSSI